MILLAVCFSVITVVPYIILVSALSRQITRVRELNQRVELLERLQDQTISQTFKGENRKQHQSMLDGLRPDGTRERN